MSANKTPMDLRYLTRDLQLFIAEAQRAARSDDAVERHVARLKEIMLSHMMTNRSKRKTDGAEEGNAEKTGF